MAQVPQGLVIQPVADLSQELNNRQISTVIERLQKRVVQNTGSPGVGDDEQDGYEVGTMWINTTTDNVYICTDNGLGAAVWRLV